MPIQCQSLQHTTPVVFGCIRMALALAAVGAQDLNLSEGLHDGRLRGELLFGLGRRPGGSDGILSHAVR